MSAQDWSSQIASVADRFDREYRGESFELPEEVEAMPIFRERVSGALQAKITSAFWQLAKPQKNQRCLDIGCGVGFLIYDWRDWGALFYGQDISKVACDALSARGPQLNSKLFKGVVQRPAHQLDYDAKQFDLIVSTGVSCYYSIEYWSLVFDQVRRVLKPGGVFVFDVLNADTPLAESWAILEMYLGSEVFLESLENWNKLIQAEGGKVVKTLPGEVFQLYKVTF